MTLGDTSLPGPGSYNDHSYDTISNPVQGGGTPGNVMVMMKAHDRHVFDKMFPFLVQDRFH